MRFVCHGCVRVAPSVHGPGISARSPMSWDHHDHGSHYTISTWYESTVRRKIYMYVYTGVCRPGGHVHTYSGVYLYIYVKAYSMYIRTVVITIPYPYRCDQNLIAIYFHVPQLR